MLKNENLPSQNVKNVSSVVVGPVTVTVGTVIPVPDTDRPNSSTIRREV